MKIYENEPMSKHTTFRTGGPARRFIDIESVQDLVELLVDGAAETDNAAAENMDVAGDTAVAGDAASTGTRSDTCGDIYIVGNGSNLLVSDKGYDGTIVRLGDSFADISVDGDGIYAEAGALLSRVAAVARDNSLTGLEFAAGIPGSVGGGACMNAGAYGGEMKDVCEYVDVLILGDTAADIREVCGTDIDELDDESNSDAAYTLDESGKAYRLCRIAAGDMDFGYRHSIASGGDVIVLGVMFRLMRGDKAEIGARMRELSEKRRSKQPLEYPSAGSTFKRPEGYFAGKLIEDAGLKGRRVGGAMVSEKHSGFIVNYDGATSSDIYELIQIVRDEVKESFGVTLEPEVRILGDFNG